MSRRPQVIYTREIQSPTSEIRQLTVWLYDHAHELVERANRDSDEAMGSPGDSRRAPGHSDPTLQAATNTRYDPAGAAAKLLAEELALALDSVRRAHRLARGLLPTPASKAAELVLQSTVTRGGHCANCGRWVENTRLDRLRSGRCDACRKYRLRTGNERPRHLWEANTARSSGGHDERSPARRACS